MPPVSSLTAPATSSSRGSNVCVAPHLVASSRLAATGSTAISGVAPFSRAPCSAHRPDAAGADHEDAVARADRCQVRGGARAGHDGTAEQRQLLGGEVGAHGHRRLLGDDDRVGERPEAGAAADRRRAIGEAVPAQVRHAEVRLASSAEVAAAARRDRRQHDAVTALHGRDVRTDVDDHAGSLVSQHHRPRRRKVAGEHGHVAVADAAGLDAHDDVGPPWRNQVQFLDAHAPTSRETTAVMSFSVGGERRCEAAAASSAGEASNLLASRARTSR